MRQHKVWYKCVTFRVVRHTTTTVICLVRNNCLAPYEDSSKDRVNDRIVSTRHSITLVVCTPELLFRGKPKCFIETKLVILNLSSDDP